MSKYKRIALIALCGVLVGLMTFSTFATYIYESYEEAITPFVKFDTLTVTNDLGESQTIDTPHDIPAYTQSIGYDAYDYEDNATSWRWTTSYIEQESEQYSLMRQRAFIPENWVITNYSDGEPINPYFKVTLVGGNFLWCGDLEELTNYVKISNSHAMITSARTDIKGTVAYYDYDLTLRGGVDYVTGVYAGSDTQEVTYSNNVKVGNYENDFDIIDLTAFNDTNFNIAGNSWNYETYMLGIDNTYIWIDEIKIEFEVYLSAGMNDNVQIDLIQSMQKYDNDIETNSVSRMLSNNIPALDVGTWNINSRFLKDWTPWNLAGFLDGTLSFFTEDLFGAFSIADILFVCIGIGVLFAVLKYFAGG